MKLKLCECGCGGTPSIAPRNEKRRGWIKGETCRFIHNHHLRIQKRRHGHNVGGRETPELSAYYAAKGRCTNPNDGAYYNYGERGIQFRFSSFEEFFAVVGPRPSKRHSLDRFPDNNGHYEKGNLRWATRKQQNRNKRPYRRRIGTFTDSQLLAELQRRGLLP